MDDEFDRLLEASSFGSPIAKAIRAKGRELQKGRIYEMFKLEFDTSNAALRDENDEIDYHAISEVLEEAASLVKDGYRSHVIKDANGNTIGAWSYDDEPVSVGVTVTEHMHNSD